MHRNTFQDRRWIYIHATSWYANWKDNIQTNIWHLHRKLPKAQRNLMKTIAMSCFQNWLTLPCVISPSVYSCKNLLYSLVHAHFCQLGSLFPKETVSIPKFEGFFFCNQIFGVSCTLQHLACIWNFKINKIKQNKNTFPNCVSHQLQQDSPAQPPRIFLLSL